MATLKRLAGVLIVFTVAACASAPVALVALPAVAPPDEPNPGPGTSVLLREVAFPGYLNGFPVVLGRDGSALRVSQNTEWAERPSDGVARVLRDALSQRIGPARVLIAGDGRIPDADLIVEFLALEPRASVLHLEARWFFSCAAGGVSRGGRTELDVPLAASTPQAVAAATSASLGRFADVLARAVPGECRPLTQNVARRR